MAMTRETLPQLNGSTFLTDGGMETHLIFNERHDLPHFAAFVLSDSEDGREVLRNYYRAYIAHARSAGLPFLFDTNTWRANPDWGTLLGYDAKATEGCQSGLRPSRLRRCADEFRAAGIETLISGAMGPRRDAWTARRRHDGRRGLRLPHAADRGVCRNIGRLRHLLHADQRARGHRHREGG